MDHTITIVVGLATFIIGLFINKFFPSYMEKKAENLATKEDIGDITKEIEEIKTIYSKQLEDYKLINNQLLEYQSYKNQLKIAAVDKRLQAHQEAYALWWELIGNTHNRDNIGNVVQKCQDWWVNNSLYLDKNARNAFSEAYHSALNHSDIVLSWKHSKKEDDPEYREQVNENFEKIRNAGDVIVKAVQLPSMSESEYETLDNIKKKILGADNDENKSIE